MSLIQSTIAFLYQNGMKPVAFSMDAEDVHNHITKVGENLENSKTLLSLMFSHNNKDTKKTVLGVEFENPIGLAAGFDYDGHLAQVLKHVGFGFNTVGSVTAHPYGGNPKPRLLRLPKSKSLLINKGFKSEGAKLVAKRLDKKKLKGHTVGISVGSSNIPSIDTIKKAIDDYVFTFKTFQNKSYIKYFELNISCPNTAMTESFTSPENFKKLVSAIKKLKLSQPIFVKMPNEIDFKKSDALVKVAMEAGIYGFIFSNLVKNRANKFLNKEEVKKMEGYKGNFSGRPTFKNSNELIFHTRKKFGKKIAIIGCGGVFTPADAKKKLDTGADLVQLITGMIYQGPQLIGQIVESL